MSKICKIAVKVISCVLISILLFFGIIAAVNAIGGKILKNYSESFDVVKNDSAVIPKKDSDGNWCFTTDKRLTILQITDVHIGAGFMSFNRDKKALNAVAAMITGERPDLVIVTGDIAYPTPLQSGTLNNLVEAQIFATLMEELGVYWTLSFGNHDAEVYSYHTLAKIAEYYESSTLKHCIFERGDPTVSGEGNQIIKVKNSLGVITQGLVIMDSHSYKPNNDYKLFNKDYDNIKPDQIEWYSREIAKLNTYNAEALKNVDANLLPAPIADYQTVKTMAFFHIPLQEFKTAYNSYTANGDSADVKYFYGEAKEKEPIVFAGADSDDMFETMLALKSTQAIFVGHDHLNNFSIEYKGIRLTYGMSIDYLAYLGIYKKGAQRGCTVIYSEPTGAFWCISRNYYKGYFNTKYPKEKVDDVEPTIIWE